MDGRRHCEERLSSHSMNNGRTSRNVQGKRIMVFSRKPHGPHTRRHTWVHDTPTPYTKYLASYKTALVGCINVRDAATAASGVINHGYSLDTWRQTFCNWPARCGRIGIYSMSFCAGRNNNSETLGYDTIRHNGGACCMQEQWTHNIFLSSFYIIIQCNISY